MRKSKIVIKMNKNKCIYKNTFMLLESQNKIGSLNNNILKSFCFIGFARENFIPILVCKMMDLPL